MKSYILGFFLSVIILSPIHSQTTTNVPADTNSVAANPAPTSQAPDDVIKKLSDLTHAGKYAEAQQTVTALLMLYPDDQRLIKAKIILDKLLASASPTDAAPSDSQPTNSVAQPVASGTYEQLTGMDKVEYNSLIEMAKEAQQNTDLDQQKASLKQFMDESGTFLKKYPDQTVLWEFRVAAALILNDPDAGYEAGQKLLAAGAADSNDPNLQQLISKLKIKGWLDKQGVEEAKQKIEEGKKYDWLLGTWNDNETYMSTAAFDYGEKHLHCEVEFVKSDFGAAGYPILDTGQKFQNYTIKCTIADSKEIALPSNWEWHKTINSEWQPITSISLGDDQKTMTMVIGGTTHVLTKISDSQSQ